MSKEDLERLGAFANDHGEQISFRPGVNTCRGKHIVILPSGDVQIIDTAEHVFKLIAPHHRMFSRGGMVVELRTKESGEFVLEIVQPAAARSRFEERCFFVAWRTGKNGSPVLKPCPMPEDIAKSLLKSLQAAELLPAITGLINCPIIRETNEELSVLGKGFDPESGLFITKGDPPPDVELPKAVESLVSLLDDFDFQTGGDRSRALTALITPALKLGSFIDGRIPVDVSEADQSQAGKRYRLGLVASIYREKLSYVVKKQGGVGSLDETFAEQLVAGRPFVSFDNLRGRMESQYVEGFLTAEGSYPARVPYRGKVEVDPSRFFLSLTSNGVETTRDLANRSSIVRIKKKPVGYPFRKYPEGSVLDHVRANQPFYLGCVFAVIRDWHRRGKHHTNETRHDFREWAQKLDWIVQNIFEEAPLMGDHISAQKRVSRPELVFLREVCLAIRRLPNAQQSRSATSLFDLCQEAPIKIPGLRDEKQDEEDAGKKQIGVLMGRIFREKDQIEIEDWTVVRSQKFVTRPDGKGERSIKTYDFTHQATQIPGPANR